MNIPADTFREITWREGTDRKLRSRFAAVRVRVAHRDYEKAEPYAEEWLLIEWPRSEAEPTKYWISTLPSNTSLKDLIKMAKHRWIIERDYQELKQELGLGHFEGGNWRGSTTTLLCASQLTGSWSLSGTVLPLSQRRSSPIHRRRAGTELPPTRLAASVPSGIIRPQSRL